MAEGLLTRKQLRGPHVERVLRDVYRPVAVPLTHVLQCRAAALVLPDEARITGRSWATARGVALARTGDPVEVVVPERVGFGPYRGIAVREVSAGPLGPPSAGLPLASPVRAAFDLAARHPVETGVAHLDAVAGRGLVDLTALGSWLDGRYDADVCAVRSALSLTDPRAGSPPESQTRVLLALAGIRTVPQHVVPLAGRSSARVDLAIPALRIAIEYDGAWHALREQLAKDRERLNALTAAGWLVVHVTADLLGRPEQLVAAVRAAIDARG